MALKRFTFTFTHMWMITSACVHGCHWGSVIEARRPVCGKHYPPPMNTAATVTCPRTQWRTGLSCVKTTDFSAFANVHCIFQSCQNKHTNKRISHHLKKGPLTDFLPGNLQLHNYLSPQVHWRELQVVNVTSSTKQCDGWLETLTVARTQTITSHIMHRLSVKHISAIKGTLKYS